MGISSVRSVHVVLLAASLSWGLAHCAMGSAGGANDESLEAGGSSSSGGSLPVTPPSADSPRRIEEADIYKVEGNRLYILNRYRGLQVVDISNLDMPRFLGQFPIYGYPKEMFVRGPNAYVIVSDVLEFADDPGAQEANGTLAGARGSRLRIINVEDPAQMQLVGGTDVDGDVFDQRIVGHVLYLVAAHTADYGRSGQSQESGSSVVSLDIADPAHVAVVETEQFPSYGSTHHIAVTTKAIFLAESTGGSSTVTYIDISDPQGVLRIRGQLQLPGDVLDRFAMDEQDGVLRVAVGSTSWNGAAGVVTVSLADPDNLAILGTRMLEVYEQIKSARFDGNRGYLVTYRNIDPLFLFDLTDPRQPVLKGELEMSGWLDFLVPVGDRVVAMGHEDVAGDLESGIWRRRNLAVSLVDPTGDRPRLVARVQLDGVGGWAPAERDDFNKLFRVFPEQHLVVFPYRSYGVDQWRVRAGIQLLDFTADSLTARANITDAGWVERGTLRDPQTLLTISSQVFQVVDISNRDAPQLRARMELARHVTDFALLDGDYAVQLSGDFNLGSAQLTVTPRDQPDTLEPLAQVDVNAPTGRLFMNGGMAYVVGTFSPFPAYAYWPWTKDTGGDRRTTITTVDLTDPTLPMVLSTIRLPKEVLYAGNPDINSYGYQYSSNAGEVVQVGEHVLALHRMANTGVWGCSDTLGNNGEDEIYVVDLENPDHPRLAATITLSGASYVQGLRAVGSTLFLTGYQYTNTGYAYRLYRFDVADPSNPQEKASVTTPGQFVGYSEDGETAFTLRHDESGGANALHALRLGAKSATDLGSVSLGSGTVSGVLCQDGACVVSGVPGYYASDWNPAMTSSSQVRLEVVDVRDPQHLARGSTVYVPVDSGRLVRLQDGYAFVNGGTGTFVYQVQAGALLKFVTFFRTEGFANGVVLDGAHAYVPTGYHGVQQADLDQLVY